jgi:GLPGLI family protein
MKKLHILSLLILSFFNAFSQDQIPNTAIIQLTVETITPDENALQMQSDNQFSMRIMNGEIKSTIWVKDDKTKTEADMGMGKSMIYFDGKTKTTTTLFEMMGRKMGFYTNEEEMKRLMNSQDSGRVQRRVTSTEDIQIEYLSETKTIAGKTCKKAIIHYKNRNLEDQQQEVWYYPDYKLSKEISLNTLIRAVFVPGINKLKGFPMEMEMKRSNGITTRFTVTKIETGVAIEDASFNIPTGYDLKPMSEMNQGGRGRIQFRVENE